MDSPQAHAILDRALALVRFLRVNCPWDAAQTPTSLLPYLLEEAHETAEAVQASDEPELRAELGDLLLNVAFQIVLAEERGVFTAEDGSLQLSLPAILIAQRTRMPTASLSSGKYIPASGSFRPQVAMPRSHLPSLPASSRSRSR